MSAKQKRKGNRLKELTRVREYIQNNPLNWVEG